MARPTTDAAPTTEADELLMQQMRAANEALVVATVRAEHLAEEAEAARAVASASEERFRSLVLASAAIVWRADQAGAITFESDAWVAFTGAALDDWLGAIHPDDRERVQEMWEQAVATSSLYMCEHRLVRADGSYAWVVARAVPVRRDAAAREWIGTMTDITARIEMDRARERFMAILSHDLRSPLASISIGADALGLLKLEEPYATLVREMRKTTQRMGDLTKDIMDFARGRLGTGMPMHAKGCELGVICAEIVAELARVSPDRKVLITRTGDLRGDWDAGRLGQLLGNLIGNAIKHGTGEISVSLVGEANVVQVTVENHGPTIAADDLALVFEPFAHAGPRERSDGLGLGLYIASEIVRAHRGTITVTSEDDVTTFTVRLPRE